MRTIQVNLKSWLGTIKGTINVPDLPTLPNPLFLVITRKVSRMLQFKLVLPAPTVSDVVSRELSVKVGEAEAVVKTVDAVTTEVDGFEGADNAAVAVSLIDVDDAGNRSPAREQTFTLADTIAPPQPGEIGLAVVSEN